MACRFLFYLHAILKKGKVFDMEINSYIRNFILGMMTLATIFLGICFETNPHIMNSGFEEKSISAPAVNRQIEYAATKEATKQLEDVSRSLRFARWVSPIEFSNTAVPFLWALVLLLVFFGKSGMKYQTRRGRFVQKTIGIIHFVHSTDGRKKLIFL